ISDRTETIFRNLVAYEKYIGNSDFTDYLFFMDCLINSPKDVELLRHRGIIENMLGDDEYVSCSTRSALTSLPKYQLTQILMSFAKT
ncbi:DUF247 domain-containing protein, partial [Klebsiella pneumoniae]|uniref:DUF247 domain-containing protein n=1 Tax=Klebsiella pneumoniae TaxID=573 RepID=UPI001C6078DC